MADPVTEKQNKVPLPPAQSGNVITDIERQKLFEAGFKAGAEAQFRLGQRTSTSSLTTSFDKDKLSKVNLEVLSNLSKTLEGKPSDLLVDSKSRAAFDSLLKSANSELQTLTSTGVVGGKVPETFISIKSTCALLAEFQNAAKTFESAAIKKHAEQYGIDLPKEKSLPGYPLTINSISIKMDAFEKSPEAQKFRTQIEANLFELKNNLKVSLPHATNKVSEALK